MQKRQIRIYLPDNQIREFTVKHGLTLGRSESADICVPDSAISKVHALFVEAEGRFFVRDMGSANGIFLSDGAVLRNEQHPLSNGTIFFLGKSRVEFLTDDETVADPGFKPNKPRPNSLPSAGDEGTIVDQNFHNKPPAPGGTMRDPGFNKKRTDPVDPPAKAPAPPPRAPNPAPAPASAPRSENKPAARAPEPAPPSGGTKPAEAQRGTIMFVNPGDQVGQSIADAEHLKSANGRLIILNDAFAAVVKITKSPSVIGRQKNPTTDIVIDHPSVSTQHARFIFSEGRFRLEDQDSRNKTYLYDEKGLQDVLPPKSIRELPDIRRMAFGGVEAVFMSDLGGGTRQRDIDDAIKWARDQNLISKAAMQTAVEEAKREKCAVIDRLLVNGSLDPSRFFEGLRWAERAAPMQKVRHLLFIVIGVVVLMAGVIVFLLSKGII